jgi:hypothetical protein
MLHPRRMHNMVVAKDFAVVSRAATIGDNVAGFRLSHDSPPCCAVADGVKPFQCADDDAVMRFDVSRRKQSGSSG